MPVCVFYMVFACMHNICFSSFPYLLVFHYCDLLLRVCTRKHKCILLVSGATYVCSFLPCSCIPLWFLLDDFPLYALLCECSVPASPSFTISTSYCVCALTNMNAYFWWRGERMSALFWIASMCLPLRVLHDFSSLSLIREFSAPASPCFTIVSCYCVYALNNMYACCW